MLANALVVLSSTAEDEEIEVRILVGTVVEVLLSAGLDVNVRTGGGTALHEAALCGKVEVVRTLLDAGVDLGARDAQRNTVMDLLGQFPKHVTQDITDIIKNHRCGAGTPRGGVGSSGSRAADPEDRDSASHPPLPPIPVPDASGLGSPYENVRVIPQGRRRGMEDSSPGTSPTQWEFYHNSGGERMSGASIASGSTADGVFYQSPPVPKTLSDGSYMSEDLSPYHQHHHHHHHPHRDPDQMSVSSATSSTGGVYMPMVAGHAHSPGSNSKVSPTPPKKPPRRNLSVSPTHLQPTMTMSADGGSLSGSGGGGSSAYEYLFLARSGVRSQCDLEEMQGHPGAGRRDALLRQGRSVDQYVDMKLRHSLLHTSDSPQGFSMRGRGEESDENRKPQLVNAGQHQPVAITSMYENVPVRTTNPRRKLRRHYTTDRAYENYEPIGYSSEAPGAGGNSSLSASPSVTASGGAASEGENHPKFVSSAYITLKSSQESLLEEGLGTARRGSAVTPTGRKGVAAPSSPTHYQQPPTPDHPPPSALQAEKSIQDRIRPLSQVSLCVVHFEHQI
uniref:(California timema) hypothetical protein n=1 Tax=Timema californicum TaxID=61474 RepID=A0A7R9IZF1_TIMCA|nr:unnamed protein product [Timema californicum]